MAISAQQLTIYLYSAHRAVIFAIAQLSCITFISEVGLYIWWFSNRICRVRFTCNKQILLVALH